MTDITTFLTARLDEDEAIARHAIVLRENRDRWQVGNVTYREDYAFVSILTPDGVEIAGAGFDGTGGIHGEVFATHIARHDPARVLAEIAAKRDHLKMWTEAQERRSRALEMASSDSELHRRASVAQRAESNGYCEAVMRLFLHDAAVYADHPDYNPAWAAITPAS